MRTTLLLLILAAHCAHAGDSVYLHFIQPTYYSPDNSPPKWIISARLDVPGDFDVSAADRSHSSIAGYIEARGDKFLISLRGHYLTSTGTFKGEAELEKPVPFRVYFLPSGAICETLFVLSRNSDCRPILEMQAKKDADMARK